MEAFAALYGHFSVLKWCQENGCPWGQDTCGWVAEFGDLEVVQWCIDNGCPCDEKTSGCAAIQTWSFEAIAVVPR